MEKDILVKLRKLREERGVKPMELATYLNIDESAYNRMENGVNHTWGKYLLPLLEFYQIQPSDFFKDIEGKNFIHQDVKEINDSAQNIGLIETFNSSEKSMYDKLIESYEKTIIALEDKIKLLEDKLQSIVPIQN